MLKSELLLQIITNTAPTPDNLRRWGVTEIDTSCSLCRKPCTLRHVLNACSVALFLTLGATTVFWVFFNAICWNFGIPQGKSLTTSKHHSFVSSPSVPEYLACLSPVAHVDLSRTKTPSAVLKTENIWLIRARALSFLRRSQPRTNGQIS